MIHDWTQVDSRIVYGFQHGWTVRLANALNRRLPETHYALLQQRTYLEKAKRHVPYILDFSKEPNSEQRPKRPKPNTAVVATSDMEIYRRKKNILAIRHVTDHRLVAVLELISPGNKSGRRPVASLVRKVADFLNRGVHVSLVDPFPPGPYDKRGIHGAIWAELTDETFAPPAGKPLITVGYESTVDRVNAFATPFAVGDTLADLPLYIGVDDYVNVPLDETYVETWDAFPAYWKDVLTGKRAHPLTNSEV